MYYKTNLNKSLYGKYKVAVAQNISAGFFYVK